MLLTHVGTVRVLPDCVMAELKSMESLGNSSQGAMLHALLQANCYPHEVAQVELIETHISTILLAGSYAYKIKKPVNLGFLDFSTLELRRGYCFEELRLNRRLAPSLYLEVVAIIGSTGSPRFAPHASPGAIEYAVKMRRFDQSALLDHMLVNGELTSRHLDVLAETTAAFHSRVANTSDLGPESDYGKPDSIAQPMRQNFEQIRPLLDTVAETRALDRLEEWSVAAHSWLAPLMAERNRNGFVRECHGDLHLGNITWIDDDIQIFDCIEFSPRLRWIDVASEIAFTAMDLFSRGRPAWAWRFLNAYLEITGDYEALRLLNYYMVYRAMVRAKVARIRAIQSNGEVSRLALADYSEHIQLASAFTETRRLALIITRGVSGSGKTTVSQPVLEQIGALRLRSDVVRKGMHGLKPTDRSDSTLASGLYADRLTRATYDELLRLARVVLEAGFSAIVDATFLLHSQRAAFKFLAAELNLRFLILECRANFPELHRRVGYRLAKAADASEATHAVLDWQLQHDESLDACETEHAISIDTENFSPVDVISEIAGKLAQ